MINKKDRFNIPFPVLYDTAIYTDGILKAEKRGYYNYTTDKFDIPKREFMEIEKNPKFCDDLKIIKGVGFNIT